MSTFTEYLTEATKSYDYKIKVAGDIDKDFTSRMETALGKFELQNMSAGKKTPIQKLPLDFPALSNEAVTIFDVTTAYPVTSTALKEYLADYMRVAPSMIVVRKPGEPSEEYQDEIEKASTSEYKNKLMDIEMKDSPKVNKDEFTGDKYNMSLMRELLKSKTDRQEITHAEEDSANKDDKKLQDREDKPAPSPFTTPTNPHPDPKRK
jgi:hypothetical protein